MPPAPLPPDEAQRLRSLWALEILDTPPEQRFDRLTRLAVAFTGCPMSTVTLVDESRQWSKSATGTDCVTNPRSESFCAYTILRDEPLIIPDTHRDSRVADNPLVTGNPYLRAYVGVPLSTGDGQRVGSFCVLDVTPRVFRPEDIEVLTMLAAMASEEMGKVEANRLVRELQEAREAADRASQTKSGFLAMMGHEIRTPLNGVIGYSDLMLSGSLSEVQKEYAEGIRTSAETLRTLLNDLLDFSKIEAGRLDVELRPTDIREEVSSIRRMFEALAGEKGIVLECTVEAVVPRLVRTDPTRFRQVLSNLLSNAIKFTRQGGVRVKVDYATVERELRVAVHDTGMGITAEEGEKLFQPFTQADSSTTRKYGGTGLGLAICRRLCEMLGGAICFDSVPGQGTTFHFTLQAPEEKTAPLPPVRAEVGITGPALRVLAAEDNLVNQRVLELTLKKLGCTCDLAFNGLEVLERLEKDSAYDIILMDVRMPELDGLETTRRLRQIEKTTGRRRLPVVAFTADVQASDRKACMDAGMDAVLTKPLQRDDLQQALTRYALTY